jgi:hypothetical protein
MAAKPEDEALLAPYLQPMREGVVLVKPPKKSWRKRWLILKGEFIYKFSAKPTPGCKELKDGPGIWSLKDVNAFPSAQTEKDKAFVATVETPLKTFLLAFESEEQRAAWLKDIAAAISASQDIDRLSPEQEKVLATVQSRVNTAVGPFDRKSAIRFLRATKFDAEKAILYYDNNALWRRHFGVDKLTVAHVGKRLKEGEIFYPNLVDKRGRPVVCVRARLHNPDCDYSETLSLVIYLFEKAFKQTGKEEAVLIYDLSNYEKQNADNRTLKFLLDIFQYHYPGRISSVFVLNAPFFYRLLWKMVKPWLSGELMSKVNMLTPEDLRGFIQPSNLLVEHGGTATFDLARWMQEAAALEGVSCEPPYPPHPMTALVAPMYHEVTAEDSQKGAQKISWMKKQGGVVKLYNKRLCVLRTPVFYYFYTAKDTKAEGAIPLAGARVEERKGDSNTVFHVLTFVGKDCIFDAETLPVKQEWMVAVRKAIEDANEMQRQILSAGL